MTGPDPPLLSFVIPCLNEAETLGAVLEECRNAGELCGCTYEILVADNGSDDGSQEIARALGVRVLAVDERGYGAALAAGIEAARGTFVLMGDADLTYDFTAAPRFLALLEGGCDLVLGNRFQGRIEAGAMPLLHRYLGNPVLSALGRQFFGIRLGDFHCGLRAFRREAILGLALRCAGMEFASEMIIKASLMGLSMAEVPTTLRPNPPGRRPHLKTWRDGWRHLKFMLSFSPKYSFLPLACLFALLSVALLLAYTGSLVPFTGPNTLVFSFASLVMAAAIVSEYLSSREIIYSQFPYEGGALSRFLTRLLGLHKGTDRLFRLAALLVLAALAGYGCLLTFAFGGLLYSRAASLVGALANGALVMGIFAYLAAARISTYRFIHPDAGCLPGDRGRADSKRDCF
jgi:glycosyltransferase involved in cell wall biosynthesis